MTNLSDTLGMIGSYLFVAGVLYALWKTMTWGEVTKEEERRFLEARQVNILDEEGTTVTIIRQANEAKKD